MPVIGIPKHLIFNHFFFKSAWTLTNLIWPHRLKRIHFSLYTHYLYFTGQMTCLFIAKWLWMITRETFNENCRFLSSCVFIMATTGAKMLAKSVFIKYQQKAVIVPGNGLTALRLRSLAMSASTEFSTLRPRQNWRHFADDIFNGIFLNSD